VSLTWQESLFESSRALIEDDEGPALSFRALKRHRLDHGRFLMRPGLSGSPVHRFRPGGGGLLVMGGNCQHGFGERMSASTP
jgi:hypothetical protein